MTDHFSAVAKAYARSRPTYPPELFEWLAKTCVGRDFAWDVGAGNGQASVALAAYFQRVLATDLSAAQIGAAPSHDRIEYRVAPAERSGLADACADLVTVAQALHWFDFDTFYAEVRRVLKPDGLLAVWTYGALQITDGAIGERISHYDHVVVGPYWPPERRHVESAYGSLAFPFAEITSPALSIRLAWTLDDLLGYCRSWSATSRFQQATGLDPVPELDAQLQAIWGDRARSRLVTWPIAMRAGFLTTSNGASGQRRHA